MATAQQTKAITQTERITLHNISWKTYECLLADHESASAPRFTYDRGELEIMSPRSDHERFNRRVSSLVEVVVDEWEIDCEDFGSTTFKREDLERGFEPDSCFYIQHEPAVRGKGQLDLNIDPPPDIVIEIDLTHSSLNKLGLYAALGVPEVWRYNGENLEIRLLERESYAISDQSAALPGVTATDISELIAAIGATGRSAWLRRVRKWARGLPRE